MVLRLSGGFGVGIGDKQIIDGGVFNAGHHAEASNAQQFFHVFDV